MAGVKKLMNFTNSRLFLVDAAEFPARTTLEDIQWIISMSVEERLLFTGSLFFTLVDRILSAGSYYYLLRTPPKTNMLLIMDIAADLETVAYFYKDPIITTEGTELSFMRRNFVILQAENTFTSQDPTFSDKGTLIGGPLRVASEGSKPNVRDTIPLAGTFILPSDTEFLFEFDIANNNTHFEMALTWGEREVEDDNLGSKAQDTGAP